MVFLLESVRSHIPYLRNKMLMRSCAHRSKETNSCFSILSYIHGIVIVPYRTVDARKIFRSILEQGLHLQWMRWQRRLMRLSTLYFSVQIVIIENANETVLKSHGSALIKTGTAVAALHPMAVYLPSHAFCFLSFHSIRSEERNNWLDFS